MWDPGDDVARAETLGWLLQVLRGEQPVGAAQFVEIRDRLLGIGLDERIAVGLIAGHLRLSPTKSAPSTKVRGADKQKPEKTQAGTKGRTQPQESSQAPAKPKPPKDDRRCATKRASSDPADARAQANSKASSADDGSTAPLERESPKVVEEVEGSIEPTQTEQDDERPGKEELLAGMSQAIRERDLSLAYWLARCLDATSADARVPESPVPPAALATFIFAARANASDDPFGLAFDEQAQDVITFEPRDMAGVLVACAGSLRASIVLPYGNGPQLLGDLGRRLPDTLSELAEVIAARAPRGGLSQPTQAAAEARAAASREEAEERLRTAARKRLERARHETNKYVPAVRVWRQLVFGGPGRAATRGDCRRTTESGMAQELWSTLEIRAR